MLTKIVNGKRVEVPSEQLAALQAERAEPTEAERLAQWRETASLTRPQFLVACVKAGILTEADAEDAASGKWPEVFSGFIASLPLEQRIAARALWADKGTILRGDDLIGALAAHLKMTEAQVDALFGWEG